MCFHRPKGNVQSVPLSTLSHPPWACLCRQHTVIITIHTFQSGSASFIVCTEVPWTVTFAYCSFSCHLTKRSCLDLESALKLGSVSWTKCQAQARFESIQHVNPAPCTQAFLQSHSPSTVNSQPSDNYQIPPSESGSSRAAGRRAPVHCFHHHI